MTIKFFALPAWSLPGLPNFANTRYAGPMSTMNISLPDSLKEYVDRQVSSLGFGSSSEYVRGLIRKDRDRQRLRGLLYEGAASSSAVKIDSDYFDRLRDQVREAGER